MFKIGDAVCLKPEIGPSVMNEEHQSARWFRAREFAVVSAVSRSYVGLKDDPSGGCIWDQNWLMHYIEDGEE